MKKTTYQQKSRRYQEGDLSEAEFYRIKGLFIMLGKGYDDLSFLINCRNKNVASAVLEYIAITYLMDDGHESK